MELNTVKNVRTYQKYLYSMELSAYAELCKDFKKLAKHAKKHNIIEGKDPSMEVEEHYGKILQLASSGDMAQLQLLFDQKFISEEELNILQDYSKNSLLIYESKRLADALCKKTTESNENGKLRYKLEPKNIAEFHSIAEKNPVGKAINKFAFDHSRTILGAVAYHQTVHSLASINDVDPNHIAGISPDKLLPSRFGATISGFTGNVRKLFVRQSKKNYEDSRLATLGINAEEKLHDAKNFAADKFYAAKGSLKRAWENGNIKRFLAKAGVVVATAAIIGAVGVNTYQVGRNVMYAHNDQTPVTISQEVQDERQDLMQLIENLESGKEIPSRDVIESIRDRTDALITAHYSSKITPAIEEQYQNLQVNEVQNFYDGYRNKNGFYITVTNPSLPEGQQTYTLETFSPKDDPYFGSLLSSERTLDSDESYNISNMYTGNYTDIPDDVHDYLKGIQKVLSKLDKDEHLGVDISSDLLDALNNGDLPKVQKLYKKGFIDNITSNYTVSDITIRTRPGTEQDYAAAYNPTPRTTEDDGFEH